METAATPLAVGPKAKEAMEVILLESQMCTVESFPHSPVAVIFLISPPAMSRLVISS